MPGSPEPDDVVGTVHDKYYAAKRLGTTPRHVLELAAAGELQHYRLTRKTIRFSDEQIDAFLASREVAS